MGIKDQFQDKAQELSEQSARAKQAMGGAKNDPSARASRAQKPGQKKPKSTDESMQEAQDRFNQDYDA
ncbi:hypothetical protein [Streptomyces sp. NBC_00829]|uniref:hypothetical protein n=1 Tax=Streptomyces sp. NBC_00829 TaxID=2903679 RepID=UPI003869ACD2|nr:hypothetical protein OG293_21080 [Streptomyces sp. NBC_00829]